MTLSAKGSHAQGAYSRFGRHRDLYAINLSLSGAQYNALMIIAICFLTLLILSVMWLVNFKSESHVLAIFRVV